MGEAVERGLGVLERMRAEGVAPTPETYLHLLSLLANAAAAGHDGVPAAAAGRGGVCARGGFHVVRNAAPQSARVAEGRCA